MSDKNKLAVVEAPAPRSLDDINKEYTALCAQAGQKQYQIKCFQEDLDALNRALRAVNEEAVKSKSYEQAQAVKAAEESKEKEPANA